MSEVIKKHYKNIDEQIDYLVTNKNIDRNTIDRELLLNKSYLSAINPYTELVCIDKVDGKHVYSPMTNFEMYVNHNTRDDLISRKLRTYIGFFEKKFKNFIGDTVCNYMSRILNDESCCDYGFLSNYACSITENEIFIPIDKKYDEYGSLANASEAIKNQRLNTISEIMDINLKADHKNTDIVAYYKNKGYIPFWVLVHGLSLNKLCIIFGMFKLEVRKKFLSTISTATEISNEMSYKFTAQLFDMVNIRNITNHYEPIYPFIINYNIRKFYTLKKLLKMLKRIYPYEEHYPQITKIHNINRYQHKQRNIEKINLVIDILNK